MTIQGTDYIIEECSVNVFKMPVPLRCLIKQEELVSVCSFLKDNLFLTCTVLIAYFQV